MEIVMNSRLAISAFVAPAPAWRATWVSCGVRPNGFAGRGVSRDGGLVARCSPPARSANAAAPMAVNMSYAACSCVCASRRRFRRRSHSP